MRLTIDLAGRDVLEAVQTSVTPKVIRTPEFTGVAQNGVEVKVITQITVQSNIERIVGGAGEDTVIARVGEAVVSTVGETREHTDVLENPNSISKKSKNKDLETEQLILFYPLISPKCVSVTTLKQN